MPELRWILVAAGVVLLAGIWWWESRRRARTPQEEPESLAGTGIRSEPRLDGEETQGAPLPDEEAPIPASTAARQARPDLPPIRASRRETSRDLPVVEIPEGLEPELARPAPREELPVRVPYRAMEKRLESLPEDLRKLPPDELAEADRRDPWVRTQPLERDKVSPGVAALPEMAQEDLPLPPDPSVEAQADTLVEAAETPAHADHEDDPQAATQVEEQPQAAAAGGAEPRGAERQKIVALRLVAGEDRWPGDEVIHALEAEGMRFGKYSIFHRERDDGKSIFYVASMIEPGSFDLATVDTTTFPGVSVFAVLPGPVDAGTTFDMMLATARRLAQRLSGHLQDEQGSTLTAQRVLSLREEVVHFEHVSRRMRAR